jgi:protein-tyrosine phosphatase
MDIINKEFFNSLINFDTFSRLPPNTDIHLSKTGYFVPTCGKLSGIIGAQTISNMYNGYTGFKLACDINDFMEHLILIMEQMIEISYISDKQIKYETGCKVTILARNFKQGYGDEHQGLACLLKVYENTEIYDKLYLTIVNFKNYIEDYKRITKTWLSYYEKPCCPEITFSDQEWEYYIKNSTNVQYETIGFYKYYMQYSTSLFYNELMNNIGIWHWFDLIHDFNGVKIYLGAMPLKSGSLNLENRNDLITIQDLNINAILSVVEGFENKTEGYIYTPVMPDEWQHVNIKYCQIPIPDFGTVLLDKIHICVEYIHWNIKNNRNVYIQCRVGKNRSTLVLMAYFVKYMKYTAEDAYNYIKSKRVQIQNKHFKILKEYESYI